MLFGTSRNTGSDKQTYYKLSLSGSESDSVRKMAQPLFDGGCVDGDNALCEAALSARCFLNLCELGVPFPMNRYGEYVGYKTDHDPYARATSAGPLTSKFMTEALEKEAKRLEIPVYEYYAVIKVTEGDVELFARDIKLSAEGGLVYDLAPALDFDNFEVVESEVAEVEMKRIENELKTKLLQYLVQET